MMFGSPVFACLGGARITLDAARGIFGDAERFANDVIRWALNVKRDTRVSVLHLLGNCESLQLLTHKQCFRFFKGLENHPRAASGYVQQIQRCDAVDAAKWGVNTITWWPQVLSSYQNMQNTKPLYQEFRKRVV